MCVLEGSIHRAGNRVRITAQLIEAAGGSHLWAERYDRDLTDIFEVKDEVARRIRRRPQGDAHPGRLPKIRPKRTFVSRFGGRLTRSCLGENSKATS